MVNKAVRCVRAICRLAKAWLGLPYVSVGILVLLVLTWFSQPPDLILSAMLLLAFPVSWLCRLQCEREQQPYKKLYMNCTNYRQPTRPTQAPPNATRSCPFCNKTISSDYNFCPYCAADLRRQNLQSNPIP